MENIHNHTKCPACSANLTGTEKHCPFCGYRIIVENADITSDPENKIESQDADLGIPERDIDITDYNSPEIEKNNDELINHEINKLEDEIIVESTDQQEDEVNQSENLTADVFVEPVVSEKEIEINEIETDEFPKNEISLLNDDEAEIEEKNNNKKIILVRISLAVLAILIVIGTLVILHYYNKVDVFFLPDKLSKTTTISKTVVPLEKNFYFCYSMGKVNKKNTVVFSKIFFLEDKGNNESSATKKYNEQLKISFPNNADNLKTTVCKKFGSPVLAFAEKDKLMNKYLKQKYNFLFIEVK